MILSFVSVIEWIIVFPSVAASLESFLQRDNGFNSPYIIICQTLMTSPHRDVTWWIIFFSKIYVVVLLWWASQRYPIIFSSIRIMQSNNKTKMFCTWILYFFRFSVSTVYYVKVCSGKLLSFNFFINYCFNYFSGQSFLFWLDVTSTNLEDLLGKQKFLRGERLFDNIILMSQVLDIIK